MSQTSKMTIDYLIVGQGISGTFLSWYLGQHGMRYMVIDDQKPNSASRVAAGIINPVTGRRMVKTWMIDELIPFAKFVYSTLGNELNIHAITECRVRDFFPTPQMRSAFMTRMEEDSSYLDMADQSDYAQQLNYSFGYGTIRPAFLIHLQDILAAWRIKLETDGNLIGQTINVDELSVSDNGVRYQNIEAKKIIFCDGAGAAATTWFGALPFAYNKGECLLVEIPGLARNSILKKGISLVPLYDDVFWAGSTYEWHYEDDQPSAAFYKRTVTLLKDFLKIPFNVVGHEAALRPATLERRPFVGFHPGNPAIGILNGMGTKGCSLAPYYARQLADHLYNGREIDPSVDVRRFNNLLKRTIR